MKNSNLGEYAFLGGVIIAILAGLASAAAALDATTAGWIAAILVILGIVVGLLNIGEKETTPFLVAAIALVIAGATSFGAIPTVGVWIDSVVRTIAIFVAPAAIIVALKAVYALGK